MPHYKKKWLTAASIALLSIACISWIVTLHRKPVFDHRFSFGDHDFFPSWSLAGLAIDGSGNRFYLDSKKNCIVVVLGADCDEAWELFRHDAIDSKSARICIDRSSGKFVKVIPIENTLVLIAKDAAQLTIPIDGLRIEGVLDAVNSSQPSVEFVIRHLNVDANPFVRPFLSENASL